MNFKTWTVGIAVLTLSAASAFAETEVGQWSYDQNVVPVGCDSCCDDCCCGDNCCGDDCCGDDCCGGCCDCGGGGLFSGMGPGIVEGFSLSNLLGFENFHVGGWTQFGWTDDVTPLSAQGSNGTLGSFLDSPDRFNLHQNYTYIERVADGRHGFDIGFRADMVYGVDAQKTQSFGNPGGGTPGFGQFDASLDHGTYGWAIPQLYAELAMGDLSVKIGHFYTIMGYESVMAPQNFFFSHALTMFNSEPFTHTGVLGTYNGFENMTLYGGWTLGWDSGFTNDDGGSNLLGGFSASLTDAVTLTWTNAYGNFGSISVDNADDFAQSVILDVNVSDRLNYVFQTDYKNIDGSDDEDVGIVNYLFFGFNDWLSFGSRVEWWRDGTGSPYTNGDRVSNYAYTNGVNIKLLDNLILRPEARTDWAPAGDFSVNNVACDMILTY